jgi:hypothetical protein
LTLSLLCARFGICLCLSRSSLPQLVVSINSLFFQYYNIWMWIFLLSKRIVLLDKHLCCSHVIPTLSILNELAHLSIWRRPFIVCIFIHIYGKLTIFEHWFTTAINKQAESKLACAPATCSILLCCLICYLMPSIFDCLTFSLFVHAIKRDNSRVWHMSVMNNDI